jgi:hypothetical protein
MGIAVLVVFLGYVAVVIVVTFLFSRVVPVQRRSFVFVTLLCVGGVLPWADHFPSKFYFEYLCSKDAGLTVSDAIQGGFIDASKPYGRTLMISPYASSPLCDSNCQRDLLEYFLSDISHVVSKEGTIIERANPASQYRTSKVFGRYWVDKSGAKHCQVDIPNSKASKYGYQQDSCIAAMLVDQTTAPYLYLEDPFDDCGNGTKGCASQVQHLSFKILRYEHQLLKREFVVARVVAYEWKGGFVTSLFTPHTYCPFKEHHGYGEWTRQFRQAVFGNPIRSTEEVKH